MSKEALLGDIIKHLKVRFNRGESTKWKHSDFIDLHTEILRDTNTNISPSTLKRIFGKVSVDEEYVPQQATLDALRKYGNYSGSENVEALPSLVNKTNNKRNILIILLLVGAAITSFILWRFKKPQKGTSKISIERIEGQLPATVSFSVELPEIDDSLFINFGDKSPTQYIKPVDKKVAHIYYIPGVFTISIQTRRQTIATTSAYIRSDKWIAFGCQRQDDIPLHFYTFPAIKEGKDSFFQITNRQLVLKGLDTTGPVLTRLSNYSPLPHTADDFVFKTIFKNFVQENIVCRSTQFQVSGTNGIIRFRLVSSGCSMRVLNVVSEQTFKGGTNDLSNFVADLGDWNTMQLINHKKQVSLLVNGKQVFTGSYLQSLGELKGLFLEFEGTGIIKNCDLSSNDGKPLYHF